MRIALKEGRTGNLTFGAGFTFAGTCDDFRGSLAIELQTSSIVAHFSGRRAKFRLRMQLVLNQDEVVLSFEEPWLFQKQLALGFSIFRTSSDYNSSYYSQIETGGEVYLRKRLFELVEGKLSYTYQIIDCQKTSLVVPRATSGLSKAVTPSPRSGSSCCAIPADKIIDAASGNRVEIDADVAGRPLGGSDDFYRLEFRGSQFFPLSRTRPQVLSLIAPCRRRAEFRRFRPIGLLQRLCLGGPYTLRGYERRESWPARRIRRTDRR